ncbi:MAG: organic hydroperoxide resistance protein [Cyanobacteria bacterium J06639_14]
MNTSTEQLLDQLGQPYVGTQMQPVYTAVVAVTPGQAGHARMSGHARSDDGKLDLPLAFPTELGGQGQGTNPEQLFAAGYAACFHGTLVLVGRAARVDASQATIKCSVTLGRDPEDGGYTLVVQLNVDMPNIEPEKAEQIVNQAYKFCPYSKAIQGNVDVEVVVR